jgi:hypothetical protein
MCLAAEEKDISYWYLKISETVHLGIPLILTVSTITSQE